MQNLIVRRVGAIVRGTVLNRHRVGGVARDGPSCCPNLSLSRGMAGKKTEGLTVTVEHGSGKNALQATNEAMRKLDDMSDAWFIMKEQRQRRWREQPSKVRMKKREAGQFRRFRRKLDTITRAVLREHELREKRK